MTGVELLLAASAVIGAVGEISAGQQAKRTAELNASLSRIEARNADFRAAQARDAAEADATRRRRQARRQEGSARARVASSGITFEGSPLDVFEDIAAENELEARLLEHEGELAAFESESEAQASRNEARIREFQGQQALENSFFRAGGRLLGAGADIGLSRSVGSSSAGSSGPAVDFNIGT